MDKNQQYYELACLLNPALSEEEAGKVTAVIADIIAKQHGIIESSDNFKKRRIAYEIGGVREAYFGAIRFTINRDAVMFLDAPLKNEKRILRHMIVEWQRPQFKTIRRTAIPTYTPKKEERAKTDVATIDKQLDEILK